MMKKIKIFHICLAVAFILSSLLCPNFAYADNDGGTATDTSAATDSMSNPTIPDCSSAKSGPSDLKVTEANTSGTFDNSILASMQDMMRKLYKALSMLFMMGHGLMCYSIEVAYICLGVKPLFCVAHLPNFNFLISGLIIYFTGGLMCMTIGMYFVDISLKLGFAVIFIPVSIGLWPFKPTHNKFSENLSIVIRNGMLFMLVAIGASYAVILIVNGVFPSNSADSSGWSQFWNAVDKKQTNILIENFSLDSLHTLVVAFCLIFGFKILASSVNDYLNYFFQDSAFGSESPMHHVGTQLAGMAANYTVKPAMSFATDVATHQAGRAIAGVGSGIAKLGSKEGRQQLRQGFQAKKAALGRGISHVVHPVDTLNSARAAVGQLANKGIQKLGNAAKSADDLLYILTRKPLNYSERKRQAHNRVIAGKIDKFTKKLGNKVEHKIAHGQLMTPQRMEKAKQLLARGGAAIANKTGKGPNVTAAQVRQRMHQAKIKTSGAVNQAMSKTGLKAVAKGASIAAHATQDFVDNKNGFRDQQINNLKNMVAGVGASAINKVTGKSSSQNKVTAKDVRNVAHVAKGAVKTALRAADNMESIRPSKILSKATDKAFKVADTITNAGLNIAKEPVKAVSALTLKPAARLGISALGGAHDVVRHPQKTYRAIKAFAQASKAQKKAVIMKKVAQGGQILFGDIKQYYNTTADTIQNKATKNGELLRGPLRKEFDPQKRSTHTEVIAAAVTYRSLKAAARTIQNIKDTANSVKNEYNSLESQRAQKGESAPKFYVKRAGGVAGKVVMRTAVTGAKLTKGTAEDTAKAVGSLLENFGKALGDNRKRGHGNDKPKSLLERIAQKSSFEQMLEDDETDELRKKEQQAYFKSLEYEDT